MFADKINVFGFSSAMLCFIILYDEYKYIYLYDYIFIYIHLHVYINILLNVISYICSYFLFYQIFRKVYFLVLITPCILILLYSTLHTHLLVRDH